MIIFIPGHWAAKSVHGHLRKVRSSVTVPSLRKMYSNTNTSLPVSHVIPRPPHWGGYRVIPSYIEFWQGRESRLHDRIAYQSEGGDTWKIQRLAP